MNNGGRKIRVGLVGCGLVAQVMHLPYLRELSDRYEIGALCDLSDDVLRACSERYGVARTTHDWTDLLDADLDALLVLTSGSHAPVAVAAAEAGLHVFVEKPMCFSAAEGAEMVDAARRADVRLMVGYMKRYDPAYERLCEERPLDDVRLIRVTTLESPLEPYVEHYPLVAPGAVDGDVLAALKADDTERIRAAVGHDSVAAHAYRAVLLDSLVHELNALRGILGEPHSLDYADLRETGVSLELTFGDARCTLSWVDLPGIARYDQEFAFYAPDRRLTLSFPSPFLRSAPTLLTIERGEAGTPRSWRSVETSGYDEAFKRELVEFHRCIVEGDEPRTSGTDGMRDVALCQAVVRAHLERRPVENPTAGVVGSAA